MNSGSAYPFRISLLGPRPSGPHVDIECVYVRQGRGREISIEVNKGVARRAFCRIMGR